MAAVAVAAVTVVVSVATIALTIEAARVVVRGKGREAASDL